MRSGSSDGDVQAVRKSPAFALRRVLGRGLHEEAQASAAVLGYNYPGSEWYIDSYAVMVDESVRPPEEDEGWLGWLF